MVVAQSGGPSPVINSSLRGIVEAARQCDAVGTVYAGRHGIEGVLKEELLDLSAQPEEEVALLRYTPAAGSVGTCRYKLKPQQTEDLDRVIEVLRAHDVGYFLYIGGNDSMDTAHRVSRLAAERGWDLVAVGVAKTIDNDVGDSEFRLIDHTPGYGSAAKYWLHAVQNANEENAGSCPADPVLVLQAMGRSIGYIPAAARLADPARQMPLAIFLAEAPGFHQPPPKPKNPSPPEWQDYERLRERLGIDNLSRIAGRVSDILARHGRCLVVISEGFFVGPLGEVYDAFGHEKKGSNGLTVCQKLVNFLNGRDVAQWDSNRGVTFKLPVKGDARGNVPGTDQRHSMAYASTVDLDEAYRIGENAVLLAARSEGGYMSTILRDPGPVYSVRYDKVPLEAVANSERTFPRSWIATGGQDVTDDFVRYARPLVGDEMVSLPLVDGRQRLARLAPIYAAQKLPRYVPQADR
jgi:6-phosphofructokinase 1